MTVAASSALDPLWYKDAIIYELHVRAFFDSNNDGIGDFPGLVQKLDYLQSLGVTCLWLLPFFPSPLRDDGYDISDYLDVHPSYGTLDDFGTFLASAHARGMQVMIELVINHTSDQHPWFQAARLAPPNSSERDFYVWSDTDHKYRDARIIFTDTEKSNWTWDAMAKAYYWHRFFSHQPDLNYENPAVLEEILKIMSFWLEMGVDALRLDAVPYLVEREGTNCENLPETHSIVKRIRGYMDEKFPNRMILAEANQWPTDVRAYFGDGDECHMAFHFPLMPRLFMALRLEDRHPVTDIIAQTPDIPENCQWALFLRNHDELTLEMVTDEERDYMYLAYSADPKMRLNFGIRRRLAPLVDNNPRRIELLNSLLFSFPGTPILYQGDEIGMGDNIYLGDRNGVRTPMQWSADRNAGFSRVNPAKLYSPVIMDPVYGYESINVEAQQEDSSSLLNWMRNMIALRKLFQVFGRGTLEFFHPANRKVLAYVRRCGGDQILCVANLSRFAQPVELDLGAFAGMTPVEMLGYVEFPKIGRAPYTLALGPYGFLWFELHSEPEVAPASMSTRTEEPALALRASEPWESLFDSQARSAMERSVLPAFLPRQRWFGAKSQTIRTVRLKDWGRIPQSAAVFVIAEVAYEEAPADTYFIPLGLLAGEASARMEDTNPQAVLCRVEMGADLGVLYDATWDEEACRALLFGLREEAAIQLASGKLQAERGKALRDYVGDVRELPARRSSSEQSNTSIIFGNQFILKLFRRLQAGKNPDCEIGRFLTEEVGFDGVPPFGGSLDYTLPGVPPTAVAMLQVLVANQGDGWQWTLEELQRYYEQCSSREKFPVQSEPGSMFDFLETELAPDVMKQAGIYYDSAVRLGKRTAEMHLALASQTRNPAFGPEPFTNVDRQVLARNLRDHAASVFGALKDNLARLPDEDLENASLVLSLRRKVQARFSGLESLELNCAKTRVHGDYHLGQVLHVENDYIILDFEGEPARSFEERRAKQSPLKDVAGMLRSFSYAAHASLLAYAARRPDEIAQLEPWAKTWERSVSAAFLRSYLATAAGAPFLPATSASLRYLLEVFLLDKALYELRYELNNRPAWTRIPLWGIVSLESEAGG